MLRPEHKNFVENLGSRLYRYSIKNKFSNIIFVCIGTNKIVGDSFGPLVGENLKKNIESEYIQIYGTLDKTVNYLNIFQIRKVIANKYNKPCIITIDSALSKTEEVGKSFINWGGIELGKAINKGLYFDSNINIKTVIGKARKSDLNNIIELQKVDEDFISNLANYVSLGIIETLETVNYRN